MNLAIPFRPKLFETLKKYSGQDFRADLIAGITVGIVALPLAMAFAIASGVPPQAGIFTAVIAGFIISALGGTKVSIGGPTGAFVIILYGIYTKYGAENLAICTIMAGVILLVMGIARLGTMIKFIPYPVTMGFTSGIAVLIFGTQIKDFFGLKVDKVPSEFFEKIKVLSEHFGTLQWPTLALAAVSLAIILFWPKSFQKRVPGSIVALLLGTAAVAFFELPVETIGSKFGGIPQSLPKIQVPALSWENMQHLFQPAFTIALLAAIESLLCAVVADGMVDDRHDSNQELMAQGLANIVSPLFGGIAATGAIARTATNVKSGARSPLAGVIHAITLLVIILAAAPMAKFIPLATLSAVLVNVALHMGEWHNFARLPKWPICDTAVFMAAFLLTVVVDLTVAVEVGMVLAAILFIKRSSENTQIMAVDESVETEGSHHSLVGKEVPEGVMVYRMFGAFFFGATDKLESALKRLKQEPEVLILRMRKVVAMDATGLNALEDLYERLHRKGKHLILSAPHTNPLMVMEKAGFLDQLGRENVCPHVDAALARAREILGLPPVEYKDPLEVERANLLKARNELAGALERANKALGAKNGTPQESPKQRPSCDVMTRSPQFVRLCELLKEKSRATSDFTSIAFIITQSLCEWFHGEWGTFWRVAPCGTVLKAVASWHEPTLPVAKLVAETTSKCLQMDEGNAGIVWRTGKPKCADNLVWGMCRPRSLDASEAGLRGGIWIPVRGKAGIFGVIEVLGTHYWTNTDAFLHELEKIGIAAGEALEIDHMLAVQDLPQTRRAGVAMK